MGALEALGEGNTAAVAMLEEAAKAVDQEGEAVAAVSSACRDQVGPEPELVVETAVELEEDESATLTKWDTPCSVLSADHRFCCAQDALGPTGARFARRLWGGRVMRSCRLLPRGRLCNT